MSPQLENIK